MTDTSTPLFPSLRIDPAKAEDGVWVTHPETGDQFRVRRLWGRSHIAAYLEAIQAHDDEHGDEAHQSDEGALAVEAVALATGIVVDWRLSADPDRKYDDDAMAAALADEQLSELRAWLRLRSGDRSLFRPEPAVAEAE